jgi:hypothetical protein
MRSLLPNAPVVLLYPENLPQPSNAPAVLLSPENLPLFPHPFNSEPVVPSNRAKKPQHNSVRVDLSFHAALVSAGPLWHH